MARTNRTAFTLVEMLVVIVIITMLVALLVPAVIGARARARRVSCMNRMDQASKAILQYEAAKGHLPGYVNQLGGVRSIPGTNNLSWPVVILEYIGRADLWKEWRSIAGSRPDPAMPEYLCPSDTEKINVPGALSFAANCGISDERGTDVGAYEAIAGSNTTYEQSAWGLFFDRDTTVPNGLPPTNSNPKMVAIGLDEIADGAQQTIMLTENVNAVNWASASVGPSGGTPVQQHEVGVVWWSTEGSPPWLSAVPDEVHINSETTNTRYQARPSSYHAGGVNAVFADGHSEFIDERVNYTVFRDQMISNQTAAKKFSLIP